MKRILVVEDDPITRDGVAEVLQEEGYAVAVAADGQEGIAQFTAFHPHLVLTDLQMPRVNGLGVIAHVRRVVPATPIITFHGRSGPGCPAASPSPGAGGLPQQAV